MFAYTAQFFHHFLTCSVGPIRINGKTADPALPDAPHELISDTATDPNYILIQCTQRLAEQQQREPIE